MRKVGVVLEATNISKTVTDLFQTTFLTVEKRGEERGREGRKKRLEMKVESCFKNSFNLSFLSPSNSQQIPPSSLSNPKNLFNVSFSSNPFSLSSNSILISPSQKFQLSKLREGMTVSIVEEDEPVEMMQEEVILDLRRAEKWEPCLQRKFLGAKEKKIILQNLSDLVSTLKQLSSSPH